MILPTDGLIGYTCDNCKKDIWDDEKVVYGFELAAERIIRVLDTGERHGRSRMEKFEKCLDRVEELYKRVDFLVRKVIDNG